MKRGDKEFHELMDQFEKDITTMDVFGYSGIDRYDGDVVGIFYNDGFVNNLFISYMTGYENAKCLFRLFEEAHNENTTGTNHAGDSSDIFM
jgi:hypothetical protein